MRREHLFVIDPLASLNLPLDSSLRMMWALARLGHGIRVCETRQLAWRRSDRSATARCRRLSFGSSAVDFTEGADETLPLVAFSAIHMRKDPPYDMDYVATTWLLDTARPPTKVYNDSGALRRYNEKLAILAFPAECKDALVASDPEALLAFVEAQAKGDAILKPLTLFGGRGVERLSLADLGREKALAQLRVETADGTRLRLVQAFDPAIFAGEVRVFTAFGKPLSWCLKRPAPGNFLANTRAGAKLEPYQPSREETARVTRVATALAKDGVQLIGFDLIGGFVSEINLTSPRLLRAEGDDGGDYAALAELIEQDLG